MNNNEQGITIDELSEFIATYPNNAPTLQSDIDIDYLIKHIKYLLKLCHNQKFSKKITGKLTRLSLKNAPITEYVRPLLLTTVEYMKFTVFHTVYSRDLVDGVKDFFANNNLEF